MIKNQFLEIADALSKVEDEGERTFLQMEIGQEEFFKLGNIIGKGREEIEAMILAQKALGAGLDVKKLKEFERNKLEAEMQAVIEKREAKLRHTQQLALAALLKRIQRDRNE